MKRSICSIQNSAANLISSAVLYGKENDTDDSGRSCKRQHKITFDPKNNPRETLCSVYFNDSQTVRVPPTRHDDALLEHYTLSVVNAVRSDNIEQLQQLLDEGHCFDCCNNQGAYLIHMACRQSKFETIKFLVKDAGVDVNVRDDMGRTILHDLCWRPTVETDIFELILSHLKDPTYLIMPDVRGHTPFDYSRSHNWVEWNTFLTSEKVSSRISQRMVYRKC